MSIARIVVSLLVMATNAGAAAAPQTIGLTVSTQRSSFDLLDSVAVSVVVHNPTSNLQLLRFPAPQEDLTEVLDRNGGVIWTSQAAPVPHGVVFPPHRRAFTPGGTTVIVRDWNETASNGWSPLPGTYVVRARLLSEGVQPVGTTTVAFSAPLPPGSLPKLHAGEAVTLGGRLDPSRGILSDADGSALLSRRLIAAPAGRTIVVRGYANDARDGTRTFVVTRWAPLGPT
jgi:hypothetical protein